MRPSRFVCLVLDSSLDRLDDCSADHVCPEERTARLVVFFFGRIQSCMIQTCMTSMVRYDEKSRGVRVAYSHA